MSSVYSEVTATYFNDRVLEKFDTAVNTLPYTLDDIKISHNDYLIGGVYNDAIDKLYKNWLWLIANAEIYSNTSPTTSVSSVHFDQSTLNGVFASSSTTPTGTPTLSTTNEVHYIKSPNSANGVVFSYGSDQSYIFKVDNDYSTTTGLISGNFVEFNKQFKFSKVISVDSSGDFLFVLDQGNDTLFKFDISGLLYDDPAIARTGLTDGTHPGRVLVKTIGGKGKINRKNKLTKPSSISIYNDEIYVLDNGNFSIKVYDLNFNFVRDIVDKDLFLNTSGDLPISISVSNENNLSQSGKVFVLSSSGTLTTYNVDFSNKQVYKPFGEFSSKFDSLYYDQKTFNKIISSPSEDNILYIHTNRHIIKFYKTDLTKPIGFFNISLDDTDREIIRSFDVESISGKDNLTIATTLSTSNYTKFGFYKDETKNEKLYHENFYSNYFTLSSIQVKPQELVNAITFNKVAEKLIYNHSALLENLSKKIYAQYNSNRVAEINTVVDSTFTKPDSFNDDVNLYIGLNEPIITDIVNRPLTKLYQQQVDTFNLLKEEYLNTNPPVNVPEILESTVAASTKQKIKIDTASTTIGSGDSVTIVLSRNSTVGSVSCNLFTTEGANTLASDYTAIPESTPDTVVFDTGVSTVTSHVIGTDVFYNNPSKSFKVFINNATPGKAVIDQANFTKTFTFTIATDDKYVVNLSHTNDNTIEEGSSTVFLATRSFTPAFSDSTLNDDLSVNIFTSNITTSDDDYTVITTDNTYKFDLIADVTAPYITNPVNNSISARELSGGTLVFSPNVSAIYFSITATEDTNVEGSGELFSINLTNTSIGSHINTNYQSVLITEKPKHVSLTLDSTISTHTAGKVAGANIWEILSANATYQEVSATHPISATVTLTDALSVYSNVIDRGAIYFDDNGDVATSLLPGSVLRIVVPETSYIIGKGGDGGAGIAWSSGSNFDNEDDVAYIVTTSDTSVRGQDGGPAISLSGFDAVQIANSGSVWGGAGGGGSGYLPVTAANMAEVATLNASSGGGGGAGIEPDGFGAGGAKYSTAGSLVSNGSDGSEASLTLGGAGGTINLPAPAENATEFLVMSGADGGGFGLPGGGEDSPDNSSGYHASFSTVYDNHKTRAPGGLAGEVVASSSTAAWITKTADITSGSFLGR